MTRKLFCILVVLFSVSTIFAQAPKPLRVFIRAGAKTHGPGQHDHPAFLSDWKTLLNERGAKAEGALTFPTDQQLQNSDVLVMYAAEAATISLEERTSLDKFLKRGGGLVVIHDAVCGTDPQWFKTVIGGAWEHGHSKWFEGNVALYFQDQSHPITKGVSNFDFDDEIYYDLHLMPEAQILAASYAPDKRNTRDGKMLPSVYDIVPQIWTYEKSLSGGEPYRAFVSIPGHNHKSFELPHYRALLLRGIAWAGKREVDSLGAPGELTRLRYPEGGPTAPQKAAAEIAIPPDFNINLISAEPLIEKPISLDWDAQGRLWVAETPEYPNGRKIPGNNDAPKADRPARDRISILEDANGDGVMDKKTVFFEGLELVTSLVFYKDGVIVSQAPDIYWLRDTDGDGKADKKITLFTGFGTRDTHAVISNLRWGLDGWIYATLGYSRGDIFSGDGKTHFGNVGDGVIRFKPDGSAMEQFCSKGSNTWGVDIAPDGEVFFSQANGNHVDHVVMPESVLARGKVEGAASFKVVEDHKSSLPIRDYKKQAYVQIDWVGGFTAASGACIYNGGAWPEKYNNTFFVTEPTVNLVHQDFLKPDGVTYIASRDPERPEKEFIASSDLWFRPIHMRVGPDGALYVLDFYNQAVVHNDTRGPKHGANNAAVRPDRDHYFGRIWRVQHKEAKKFEIPNLAKASPQELVKALEHPSGWVRNTAQRLILERSEKPTASEINNGLRTLALNQAVPDYTRILAFWTKQILTGPELNELDLLAKGLSDPSPNVRKNVAKICSAFPTGKSETGSAELSDALEKCLSDSDARVQLEALTGFSNPQLLPFVRTPALVDAILQAYSSYNDPWRRSAVAALALKSETAFFPALFRMKQAGPAKELVTILTQQRVATVDLARGLVFVANQPAAADELKKAVLETLVKNLGAVAAPVWTPNLQAAFQTLLASQNSGVTAAVLPIIARWDKGGAMKNDVQGLTQQLLAKLNDPQQADEQRAQAATSLIGIRQMNAEIMPGVGKILTAKNSPELQKQIIELLGTVPEGGDELVKAYPGLAPQLQELVVNQVLKRPESSLVFIDDIAAKKIDLATLRPLAVNRLRTHSDKAVASRANQVIDEIRGPQIKEKNQLIAKFTPVVLQPGNLENGHRIFIPNCAVCHRFNGEGKDLAPDLTGMGAHGAAELLVHILDPNRVVEPNFLTVSVETTDGETVDGMISRETRNSIVVRNAVGDVEINKKNVKSQKQTGRSLMPDGFEALGEEALRDLLNFICAGESRFRLVDLKSVSTANSTRGIYSSIDSVQESLRFKKFGVFKVGEVPFEVANPLTTVSGNNLIVLKGGSGVAKTMPQKVEIPNVNLKAGKLHFLGGVAGWGWPWGGEDKKLPVAKITVQFADGQKEEFILKNGEEFADYNGHQNVPGSKEVPDMLEHGQVRWFTRSLKNPGVIQKITLESFDNAVAPTFVAITTEVGEGGAKNDSPKTSSAKFEWGNHPRVLIVGGGASHDFDRWFNQADVAALSAKASVNYTEDISRIGSALKDIDVLYLSNNKPIAGSELRQQIFSFVDAGKPLLLLHPALWYNWNDWPEYNRTLVGGGSRGHEKYGEFEVTVNEPNHPIMGGVPNTFKISDELYQHVQDANGTPIQVLATGKSLVTGKTYPVVWITKHPKAKVVCITLGHDGAAHDLAAYKTILNNSVSWLSQKSK